jgi:flagellar FliL protein
MAEEDNESEGKKKRSLKIIILGVVVLLVLAGGTVAGLYFMGYLGGGAKQAESAEQTLQKAEQQALAPASAPGAPGGPPPMTKVTRQTPELTRFEQSYLELDRDFVVNLTNSRKVMQVKIAVMTHYDKRVLDNVRKHEFALRSVTLDAMRQATDADLARPTFRVEMAEKIRTEINAILEKYEDFGGIEAVYFTHFVVQ